jgi:hypothetical protein
MTTASAGLPSRAPSKPTDSGTTIAPVASIGANLDLRSGAFRPGSEADALVLRNDHAMAPSTTAWPANKLPCADRPEEKATTAATAVVTERTPASHLHISDLRALEYSTILVAKHP